MAARILGDLIRGSNTVKRRFPRFPTSGPFSFYYIVVIYIDVKGSVPRDRVPSLFALSPKKSWLSVHMKGLYPVSHVFMLNLNIKLLREEEVKILHFLHLESYISNLTS